MVLLDNLVRAESIPITSCPLSVSYLFTCLVNFFLKFFHSLQFLLDALHITHESSLGGFAFVLWSAWRYGVFGDLATINILKNGLVNSDSINRVMNTVLGVRV